jgi:hypothetical protein
MGLLALFAFTISVGFLVKSCFDKQRGKAIFRVVLSAFLLTWGMLWLAASIDIVRD